MRLKGVFFPAQANMCRCGRINKRQHRARFPSRGIAFPDLRSAAAFAATSFPRRSAHLAARASPSKQ